MPKLKIQRFKLGKVIVRLRQRDETLFQTCEKALEKKNKERAVIFANELAEVRKLIKVISQTQILVERIILRLETLKELSFAFTDLKPVLRILHGVTKQLTTLMPQMAYEMEKVNESIYETLAMTKTGSLQLDVPFDVKTPGGEEILQEVSALLEEKIAEKLPEPPTSIPVAEKSPRMEKVRQMVALAATCSEICEEDGPQGYVSIKDMEVERVSFKIRESLSLEDKVLEYAKSSGGQLDVTKCAFELSVQPREVEKAIECLGGQGRIKIEQ